MNATESAAPSASSATRMRDRWTRFVAWSTAEETAIPMAVARIVVCATVACHFTNHLLHGSAVFAWVHKSLGGAAPTHGVLKYVGGATETNVTIITLALIVAAACGALGLFTRPAVLIAWLLLRAVSELNPHARGGYDPLMANTLFIVLLSGAPRALALDRVLFARARALPQTSLRCFRYALVLQLAVMYGTTALYKLGSGWIPGGDASALWYILQNPVWARFPDLVSPWMIVPLQIATMVTWLFEVLGLPFLVVFVLDEMRTTRARRWFRWGFLAVGLALHVGIELGMEVGAFSPATLALYAGALPLAVWPWLSARIARARGR
jgi:hypothetical protein